jgi:hypothetical protein
MPPILLPLLALLTCISLCATAAESRGPAGDWSGTLDVGQIKLRLLFKIRKTPEGSLAGGIDSLDQGAMDIPIDQVSFQENKLHLEIKTIQGVYDGTLDSSSDKITGSWTQGEKSIPLILNRGAPRPLAESLSPADLAANKRAGEKLFGQWSATLKDGADEYHLAVNIKTNATGAAEGTLDSPDFSLKGAPLNGITYKDGKIHFEARGLAASYDGVSFNNTTTVTGQWHQTSHTLPLTFTKSASSLR